MTIDTRIMRQGERVPVVAFFGTKGGVGKTTIARRFAELVTLAKSAPNVLLVDGDVHHRGMTVEMTLQTSISCKTVHDYIASQNTSDVEAVDLTRAVQGSRPDSGRLRFIPASTPESEGVFDESAKIGPQRILEILHEVIASAVAQYDCECVVIDCGPIIDPYTATAATLADRAFVIGQNEPISFSSLKSYPNKIREFHPNFTTANMKVIINKVRGWEMLEQRRLQEDIFAAIPFTMDIVDISEGLKSTGDMQLMIFEDHITQIAEKVFSVDRPNLVPERQNSLSPEWGDLVENPSQLEELPKLKRLKMLRLLLPVGLLVLFVGTALFYAASTERHRAERGVQTAELVVALEKLRAAAGPEEQEALEAALQQAELVDPDEPESLSQALAAARGAGLEEVPPLKTQDASRENAGIVAGLVGLALTLFGLVSTKSRKKYIGAIQGLKRGGAKWMMEEMKSKRSARKTFDQLLKMRQA